MYMKYVACVHADDHIYRVTHVVDENLPLT